VTDKALKSFTSGRFDGTVLAVTAPTSSIPADTRPASAPMYELRSIGEFAAYLSLAPLLAMSHQVDRRGDGHPVMVLPPFFADDSITLPMRSFLRTIGYRAHRWGLGRNLGCTREIVSGVPRRLLELADRYGEPVSLVGWSAGGIWAREAARLHPDAVRHVITMGSPIRVQPEDWTNSAMLHLVRDLQVPLPLAMRRPEYERDPMPVPCTSIYTRSDGVTGWSACLEREHEGEQIENVEVYGSHTGLGHNPAVLMVVADRLAQRQGQWHRFAPPPPLAPYFPTPATWACAA
jgi:pimeloyl-ACP methyl ester carboxylesterase